MPRLVCVACTYGHRGIPPEQIGCNMVALPHTYKGPKGFVQVSPLGTVSPVIYTDLPEFVRTQPELITVLTGRGTNARECMV